MIHERLIEILRELDLSAPTHDIVVACRSEFPSATTDDVLEALRELELEMMAQLEWLRGDKVLH